MLQYEDPGLPDALRGLAKLHPRYNRSELEQAHALLMSHFEDVWQMFLRLERDGLLQGVNLTEVEVNSTVNPQRSKPTHPPTANP